MGMRDVCCVCSANHGAALLHTYMRTTYMHTSGTHDTALKQHPTINTYTPTHTTHTHTHHSYIHTSIHTYMPAYTYMPHTCIHTHTHTSTHPYTHSITNVCTFVRRTHRHGIHISIPPSSNLHVSLVGMYCHASLTCSDAVITRTFPSCRTTSLHTILHSHMISTSHQHTCTHIQHYTPHGTPRITHDGHDHTCHLQCHTRV